MKKKKIISRVSLAMYLGVLLGSISGFNHVEAREAYDVSLLDKLYIAFHILFLVFLGWIAGKESENSMWEES